MKLPSGRVRFLGLLPLICFLPYFFNVWELHRSNAFQESERNRKFDHLVLGPASGQGFPNRLHCHGTKALNQTHFSTAMDAGDGVAFVTVFTVYNASSVGATSSVVVGNASYGKFERSMAVLNTFVNFIQVTMPRSNVVVLTDPASDLSMSRNGVAVYQIPGDYSRDKLMLQRIRSYIAFLEAKFHELSRSPKHVTHYIFTDSDIAVVDDLRQIFREYTKFDLALTFRNNKAQPLNSGFIAVKGTAEGILRAKSFLEEVLEVYKSKYMKASRMLGDQLALAWVVRSRTTFDTSRFSKPKAFLENIGGASVLFLPCATHNWTPPEGAGQFHGMPLDVKVVHFKGSRKRLMLESWNFFNSSANMSDMLCLVLKSGRTKYDF